MQTLSSTANAENNTATATTATTADSCAAYVSMLRARRLEEEGSRKQRAQRRADIVTANSHAHQRREQVVRRRMMETKLRMLSQVEQDLFQMLDEQAQWRHVMYDNVLTRTEQQKALEADQEAKRGSHLQELLGEHVQTYQETFRDDTERFGAQRAAKTDARAAKVKAECAGALAEVLTLADRCIDFVESRDATYSADQQQQKAEANPKESGDKRTLFDRVPPIVFEQMKREMFYGSEEEKREAAAAVGARHVAMVPYLPSQSEVPPPPVSPVSPGATTAIRPSTADRNQQQRPPSQEASLLTSNNNAATATTDVAALAAAAASANPLFCSLTAKLLRAQYPAPEPLKPKNPIPKAFIVLAGPTFSGKTTVGRRAAEAHGLCYCSDSTLIEEAMAALEKDLQPEDVDDAEYCTLLDLGREARALLMEGAGVPDSLLARLVLNKIRFLSDDYSGVLFDSAPFSVEAFEAVEAELCGYDPSRAAGKGAAGVPKFLLAPHETTEGVDPNDATFDVEKVESPTAAELAAAASAQKDGGGGAKAKASDAKPSAGAKKDKKKGGADDADTEPLPPIELPQVEAPPELTEEEAEILEAAQHKEDIAGLHQVIHFDCSAETVFDRSAGIRVDTETGDEYHVAHTPPADLGVVPRLARRSGGAQSAGLHANLERYEGAWARSQAWLGQFHGLLSHVDAAQSLQPLTDEVTDRVGEIIESARREHQIYTSAASIKGEREETERLYQERMAAREQIRKQLAAVYAERGVDPLPLELQEDPAAKSKETADGKELLPLPPQTPPLYLSLLDGFTTYYQGAILDAHNELGRLVTGMFDYGILCREQFGKYWKTPDGRKKIVDGFVAELNAMQQGLRRDLQGKEELHLRCDQLQDQLFQIVDKRRDDANQLIDSLLAPQAFLDGWNDAIRVVCSGLVQVEVERFLLVKQLCQLYYASLRGDPFLVDDGEFTVEGVAFSPKSLAEAAEKEAQQQQQAQGNKKPDPKAAKAAAKKGAQKEEEVVKVLTAEDHFAPVVEKASATMKAVADKFTQPAAPAAPAATQQKGGAKASKQQQEAAPPPPEVPTVGLLAAPIINAELELAKKRIAVIADFAKRLSEDAQGRAAQLQAKLQGKLRARLAAESSAVNGVLRHLRDTIEEEASVTHSIHISGDEFAIDRGLRLVPCCPPASPGAASPPNFNASSASGGAGGGGLISGSFASGDLSGASCDGPPDDARLLSCLTLSRCLDIVSTFKQIAPDYVLYQVDFCRVVKSQDWAADATKPPVPPEVLFKRFDVIGCGAIDWREFIVHLLFWCEPLLGSSDMQASAAFGGAELRNELYTDGPSLIQLFELKTDLDAAPISKEDFLSIEGFFFEPPNQDVDRYRGYKRVLWETFCAPDGRSLDPNVFVMFLCADEQPLRGVQKAFAMAASVGDEACALTVDMLHGMFHFSTCNYESFGMDDVYAMEELETLFVAEADAEVVTFQEVCLISAGRLLLNNTNLFRRRRFV